jgi:hypothetical protein
MEDEFLVLMLLLVGEVVWMHQGMQCLVWVAEVW